MITLKNRTCVFEGATGNIGRGAVRAMARGGMNVVMLTHNPGPAQDLIDELKDAPGKVIAYSNALDPAQVYRDVTDMFGSVDVFISTTGGMEKAKPFEEITAEEMNEKLNHQITSAMKSIQYALPSLKKSVNPRVILCTSAGALDGYAGESILDSIARGSVITMTYCLARELAKDKITVNCIARGGVINDHAPGKPTDYDVNDIAGEIPVGHLGTSDEFGALVSYIASEEAAFVTGHVFNFTGGLCIR